jgi:hypothetical protein
MRAILAPVDVSGRRGREGEIQQWESFPLEQRPRPVILLDQPVKLRAGFVDSESKMAFLRGQVEASIPMPVGVLELLRPPRAAGRSRPLPIVDLQPTEALFQTDRGPRPLPAYRFTMTGLLEPGIVLDPDVDVWWPSKAQWGEFYGSDASIQADDRTIELSAFGGVLTVFHHAVFEEHLTYVVGTAITSERSVPPGTAITAVGLIRRVTGMLDTPLGDRVLVDPLGTPYVLTPA